jgi:photosystem II stability/assembly factor-like uncharacterized protein
MMGIVKRRWLGLIIGSIFCLGLTFLYAGCSSDDTSDTTGDGSGDGTTPTAKWSVTPLKSGIETSLFEIHLDVASGKIWAVGDKGIVIVSSDKGATWKKQDIGSETPIQAIFFVNDKEGWAAGDGGAVLVTKNGGDKWDKQNTGITEKIRSIFFANNTEGYAVGDAGKIISTKDGGVSWTAQTGGTNQALESVHFAPPRAGQVLVQNGWAVGGGGAITHTSNGSKSNWLPQTSKVTDPLYGVFFADETRGWVVGKSGSILRTTNGGDTWGSSAAAAAQGKNLYDIFFINTATGWTVGSAGKMMYTLDGAKWEAITNESTKVLWAVAFIDANEGWAVGDEGTILHIKKL